MARHAITPKFGNEADREKAIRDMIYYAEMTGLNIEIGHSWWIEKNGCKAYKVKVEVWGDEQIIDFFILVFSN